MKTNTKFILLSILGVIVAIIATVGLTYAFMRPKEKNENETDINVKACAKIVFKETDSTIIDLKNTYPMDEEKGLETKPYEFDISSTCEEYVGFNLYLTSLATSEITDDAIHFAVTSETGKVLASDILTNTTDGLADFDEEELNELEKGIKGEKRNIHKVFSNNIAKNSISHYKLYLWVDKEVEASETMNKTFTVGVSVKSYARKETGAEKLIATTKEDETLYYHDENLTGGAEDYSYRYAGASDEVKNFVCLDGGVTTEGTCANDDADLYRIIGLFKNDVGLYEMKLIKYDYATSTQLGETGAYKAAYDLSTSNYKGNKDNLTSIGGYYWTSGNNRVNEWVNSELRKTNLNDYYLNTYLKTTKGIDADNLIENHTWSLNGYSTAGVPPKEMYDNEMDKVVSSPSAPTQTKEVHDKIGLMYAGDYGYAASPSSVSNWSKNLNSATIYNTSNWMYMGLYDWTISRISANSNYSFTVNDTGNMSDYNKYVYLNAFGVRPCFYLNANLQIKSGDGSKDEPYRLLVE